MPSHVLSVAAQSQNATPVRKRGKKATNLRVVERSPALSGALAEALDAVSRFGKAPAYRRREIERTVDALIALLDHIDPDPDMELEEDRCQAFEDFGGESHHADKGAGDPEDVEESDEQEYDCADMDHTLWVESLGVRHV